MLPQILVVMTEQLTQFQYSVTVIARYHCTIQQSEPRGCIEILLLPNAHAWDHNIQQATPIIMGCNEQSCIRLKMAS